MANRRHDDIFIGLDIGSTKVCCVVGLHEPEAAAPSVIGVGTAPSTGMRKGEVIDVEETVSAITAAVDEAERISGVAIDRATINIDGAHVSSLNSSGLIAVGRTDAEINLEDVRRAEEAATAIQLPPNREIIQMFPRSYSVDGQTNIKDPVGMNGVRLEVEAHIVTGAAPAIKNLQRAIYQAGIDIESQVMVPLAAGRAVLSKKQLELGVAVVDIGGGTTGIAVYEEGDVLYSSILPIGSTHITNDIALGLRTDIEIAEKVKLNYVTANLSRVGANEKLRIEELGDDGVISRRDLHHIAGSRLTEIFEMVRKELASIGKDGMLPGGVVLTGGGANMPGIEEFAKDVLDLPVTIGQPHGLSGLVDKISNPAFAAPVGLMLENMTLAAHGGPAHSGNDRLGDTVDKIRKTLRNLLP